VGLGFELSESFDGSFYRLDEPFRDCVIRMSLRLGVDGLRRFLRERRIEAKGTIFVEGIAEAGGEGTSVAGAVTMKLFDEKRVPYDLAFEGDDGRRYRLRGQRDFFVHDARESLKVLPASLYDERGEEIARAVLRFESEGDLPVAVRSFRPRVHVPLLGARFAKE